MKLVRNFNNNAALVTDEAGQEMIVVGNGLAFRKRPGELLDETKIERRFVDSVAQTEQESTLLAAADGNLVLEIQKAVKAIEARFQIEVSNQQFLALVDHLSFALQRNREKIDLTGQSTRWEIRNLFPTEFQAAQLMIKMLATDLNLRVPAGEEVFLTYHFVDADHNNQNIAQTMLMTELITDILHIIQYQYRIAIDEESQAFSRFITHLRYFIIQRLRQQQQTKVLDEDLLVLLQAKYPRAYQAMQAVVSFLNTKEGWQLRADEQVYLLLHIWQLINAQKK